MIHSDVRNSVLLATVDVVFFFSSGITAANFSFETWGRIKEQCHQGTDTTSLSFRVLLLRLLSLTNILRAIGLMIDSAFHVIYRLGHHKGDFPWHKWLDWLLSSIPTLVWVSMLSVLLLFLIETYNRSQMRRSHTLRPFIACANSVAYFLYWTVALVTLLLGTYNVFRRLTYLFLGFLQLSLAIALACYGSLLLWALHGSSRPGGGKQTLWAQSNRAGALIWKASVLTVVMPLAELVRAINDLCYMQGENAASLRPLRGDVALELARLILEWIPSAILLWTFRPVVQDRASSFQEGQSSPLVGDNPSEALQVLTDDAVQTKPV